MRGLVGVALCFYLLVIALLYIPAVQKAVASFAARQIENITHTRVNIGRVEIGLMNRVILENVELHDPNDSILLNASRLSAKIDLAQLIARKIAISNVQLYGFDVNIYQLKADAPTNIQFLIDAFKSDKASTEKPHVDISSILVRRGNIGFNQWYKAHKRGQFDPAHIKIRNLNANLAINIHPHDNFSLAVKRLSLQEQSGPIIKTLNFNLNQSLQCISISDFLLESEHSHINIPFLEADYSMSPGKMPFAQKLKNAYLKGEIAKSTLQQSDFAPLHKSISTIKLEKAVEIACQFQGDLKHFNVTRLRAMSEDGLFTLKTSITAKNIDSPENRAFKAVIDTCYMDARITSQVCKQFYPQHATWMAELGNMGLSGTALYSKPLANAHLTLSSQAGSLMLEAMLKNERYLEAKINSNMLQFGTLIKDKYKLETLQLAAQVNGVLNKKNAPELKGEAKITNVKYNNYTYPELLIEGEYKGNEAMGMIAVADENLDLKLTGKGVLKNKHFDIEARADINNFAPHALNLIKSHAGERFSSHITTRVQGSNIDDLTGHINVSHLDLSNADGLAYSMGKINLTATPGERKERCISLAADFMQAHLTGEFKPSQLPYYFKCLAHHYLPALNMGGYKKKGNEDDYMTYEIHIDHLTPLKKLLNIPIQVQGPAHLSGYLTMKDNDFIIKADVPELDYNGQMFHHIYGTMEGENDSLHTHVAVERKVKGQALRLDLDASVAQNKLLAALHWNNTGAGEYSGTFKALTTFTQRDNGTWCTHIGIQPSHMIINDSTWNIHPSAVEIEPQRFRFRQFKIDQGDRFLTLDGKISQEKSDSLHIELNDINLAYVFNMIDFHAVEFGGMASGTASASQLMTSPSIKAALRVNDFTFNNALLGDMHLDGGWDKENNAITLDADIHDEPHHSHTMVDGLVRLGAPPRGGLDLMIKTSRIDLSFLNEYTDGIFHNLQGRASGWTRVFGPFKGINLEGDMLVDEAKMKVIATNVEYSLVNDSVILRPDIISFKDAMIYDHMGAPGMAAHSAVVNGALRHHNLSNLTFDFDIKTNNILGYDEKELGDYAFCGTAYATGNIGLSGRPGYVNIDINARPEAGTEFVYNQSSPTTLTQSSFIKYKHTEKDSTSTTPVHNEVEPTTDMHINFHLDLQPQATIKILMDPITGDNITLGGHGNIRAHYYNKGAFTMFGTYNIDHGVYKLSVQDVIRKDFNFKPGGTIVFGGSPIQADLDLQAVYTVPSVSLADLSAGSTFSQNNVRVNCLMNLTGKASAPQIGFDFDIPNVSEDEKQMVKSLISTEEERNMQVIYLLGIGRFYTYDYTNTEQSQSAVAMKSLLSSTLSGQINQMFSSILGDQSNWNIGTSLSTGEVGWSDMDVEGLLSGRLLDNRLLINGNFGYRDNAATNTTGFVGDFDLQWLLTRNGNVRLKAYSKTNDRYFTKSSLTTQGLGIGLKKDFSSWRDLFKWRRRKR